MTFSVDREAVHETRDDTLAFKKHSLKIVTEFINTSYNLEISLEEERVCQRELNHFI